MVELLRNVRQINQVSEEPYSLYDYFIPIEYLPSTFSLEGDEKLPLQLELNVNQSNVQIKKSRLASSKPTLGIKWRDEESSGSTAINFRAIETSRNLDTDSLEELLTKLSDSYRIVSLQTNPSSRELEILNKHQAFFVKDSELENGLALAEWMAAVDSIVTIDSHLVDLADLQGIEANVLLPYAANWRWNSHKWFPSIETYRKRTEKSWSDAINQLVEKLKAPSIELPLYAQAS